MINDLNNFNKQCMKALKLPTFAINPFKEIIITGVGGSAFCGMVLKTLYGNELKISVNKDYDISSKANNQTLLIAVSYSGNTEETLNAVNEGLRKNCQIITICSGGLLQELSNEENLKIIKVPSGLQPRNSIGYLVLPLINLFKKNKLIKENSLETLPNFLKNEKNLNKKKAKKLAASFFKKIPLIYSSQENESLSYGWKTRINENSKVHCFSHQFPELNHNEVVGYTKKLFKTRTLIIRDEDDYSRVKKRMMITKKLIQKKGSQVEIIDTKGVSKLHRVFSNLNLADFTSYELALLNKVEPEPVKIIEDLKKSLKK